MKKQKRKLNYIKILECVALLFLELEIFYITYQNNLTMFKTLILVLTIKLLIKLLKKEN